MTRGDVEGTDVSHFDSARGLGLRKTPRQQHQLLGDLVSSSNTRERACSTLRENQKGHFVLTELGGGEKQGIL